MMVPVLKIGYAMSAIAATATSLFTIILTSASGVITHIKHKTCYPRIGLAAGIGGACTSPVGVWLASISPEWAITLAVIVILSYSALTMLNKAMKMGKKPVPFDTPKRAVTAAAGESSLAPALGMRECVVALVIGLMAGVASGYVGVGGGFLMVPLMMQLLHLPMKMTSGTSLIAVFILAITGTIMQVVLGNVQWIAGISIAIGSIPGAYLGSRLISRVPERALRFLFAGMLIVAAIMMAVNG